MSAWRRLFLAALLAATAPGAVSLGLCIGC